MTNKLPIKDIFLKSVALPILYPVELLRIAWPLILVRAISISLAGANAGGEDSTLINIIFGLLTALAIITSMMAAVGCHQLFILGPKRIDEYKTIEWSGNEIKYAGWWLLIALIIGTVFTPIVMSILSFFGGGLGSNIGNNVFIGMIGLPALYLFSRMSLVLPASAIGAHGKTIAWSWRLSSENGWRLTSLIAGFPLLMYFLFAMTPHIDSLAYYLLLGAIWLVQSAIELGLLSFSYVYLIENTASSESHEDECT